MPLLTIAWRALRAEYQHRADERRQSADEARRGQDALRAMAEEVYRLRRLAQSTPPAVDAAGTHGLAQPFLAVAQRLEEVLASVDVVIVAPEGVPFTAELMELFDNVAQRQEPVVDAPRLAEVITPAVTYRGAVLQMGKAVIAVPSP
jgi:hypothetical protein